jgi:hypothetical protein
MHAFSAFDLMLNFLHQYSGWFVHITLSGLTIFSYSILDSSMSSYCNRVFSKSVYVLTGHSPSMFSQKISRLSLFCHIIFSSFLAINYSLYMVRKVLSAEEIEARRLKRNEQCRQYHLKNRERRLAYKRENHAKNKEHRLQKMKEWREKNKERRNVYFREWWRKNRTIKSESECRDGDNLMLLSKVALQVVPVESVQLTAKPELTPSTSLLPQKVSRGSISWILNSTPIMC